jgi:hypothetical protein
MVGTGVDGLHAQLSKAAFELDLDPVQAPGEAQSIVGQDLARQAVARGRELEAQAASAVGPLQARAASR